MVITYYINLIWKVANRHNNTSVSILLLIAEAIKNAVNIYFAKNLPLSYIFQITFSFELLSPGLFLVFLRL